MTVRELLSEEGKWTQGAYARDAVGKSVALNAPAAVCWCLKGALNRCYAPEAFHAAFQRLTAIVPKVKVDGFEPVAAFNDHPSTTFVDIRRVIEQAQI